jgi:glycosyltransferase involved in cell wall biosynthesis
VSETAIVIPAFNEEASIGRVVESVRRMADVIVVDDASSDGTAAVAEVAGATVVRHERNGGYGRAIDAGFRQAVDSGRRYVVTMDADGQHVPEEVARAVELIGGGDFGLVAGMRTAMPRRAERAFSSYTMRRFGLRDPLCGVKGYDVRYFSDYGGFDRLDSVGTELAIYALTRGARWTQFPVTILDRDGQSRYGHSLRANWRIWRALFHAVRLAGLPPALGRPPDPVPGTTHGSPD